MRYGTPYKGSKNSIAEWVVSNIPKAENFYDLFAGGCAVTHCALLSGKFHSCYANDIGPAPKMFLDATNGMYADEKRWISRRYFFEKRLSDPYVKYCWSFSNNGRDYIYSKDKEKLKKALHSLVLFNDNFMLKKISGVKCCFSDSWSPEERYREYRKSFSRFCGDERLQSFERLLGLQKLGGLKNANSLQVSQNDYRNIAIRPDSVVYCDIPYFQCNGYGAYSKKDSFDYKAFYEWAQSQIQLVVVSEYYMPESFICVAEISKSCKMNSDISIKKSEKLFVPEKQIEMYRQMMRKETGADSGLWLFPEIESA